MPELDKKRTQKSVETALERYRLFKYLTFEGREASTTSHIDDIGGGKSNLTSDQTGSIASWNADQQRKRSEYCEKIEQVVERLPKTERFLLEERYMSAESEYLTDYNVYCFKFDPPISAMTYASIRWRAFYKLALSLNIAVLKTPESGNT